MSNLPRFIAAVAHITDFPLEVSDCVSNDNNHQIYMFNGVTLIASKTTSGYLITVDKASRIIYELRVYGGNAIYHNTLNRAIKLDERNGKWYTMNGLTQGMAFHNLYDAMMHCGGTHGWV